MPNTLLPGNSECFSLEPPASNIDEYGFFSHYDPNSKPCTFQQEFYKKKFLLDERIGAATGISRSSVVVHGGLVLNVVDEIMNEYSRKLEKDEDQQKSSVFETEDPLCEDQKFTKRRNVLTSTTIHNAWLKKTLENIEDEQHDDILLENDPYNSHNHAISDCLTNQIFQLDLITRKWHHIPTFLEDFGPLQKPRMCHSVVCNNEYVYLSGGLIPVNISEMKSLTPIKSVLSRVTAASDISNSSHSSIINEDQLLMATNELWRLDIASKIFLCINDELDNSQIPERYNHQMHTATFIERFEINESDENKQNNEETQNLENIGKIININGKKYMEKMVLKLILVGGLGIDDQEIRKIDVFNLETQKWESEADGPYGKLSLDFDFTTEFETSVVLDNPLTGESNIIIYKKDALNPLQVIPLKQRNTYDINGNIIPELNNFHEATLEETNKLDTIRINSEKFDEKLRSLNRKIINPKMRIFGPNLLISGYCSEDNKDIVLIDNPDNEMIPEETLLPDTFSKKRLAILDKHREKELVFKSYCFSLVNGKWIELNCRCIDKTKCGHHMISEVFVWSSHHKLLFIGSSDYQKQPKTSSIGLNRLSPILQKFDLVITTILNVTSIFHKISVITNEEKSFKRAQRLFFSSQDHNYTLLNYLTFSTSRSIGSITNNVIKRFKEFAEYSTPVSDLTANQSIMPPHSMLLGKTLFSSYGAQISDFEIIPSDGDPVPCCLAVLRKRWGRYFDALLAHGYVESINNLDEHTPSYDGSHFSSISSISKTKKNSLLPYLQKEESKGSASSSLKNSFSLNASSDQGDNKRGQQTQQFSHSYFEKYVEQPLSQNVSPHTSKMNLSYSTGDLETFGKKPKNNTIFKDEFMSHSLNDVGSVLDPSFSIKKKAKNATGGTILEEDSIIDIAGDPLSRSKTAEDINPASRRGSILSRETSDSQNSKPQTLTSSSGGMVFRVPFHSDANSNTSEPMSKSVFKNNNNLLTQTLSESISSQVKRLSESRRKSLTTSLHLSDTPRNSKTQSINSDHNKPMSYILPDIDIENLPKLTQKPEAKPPLPPNDSVISNDLNQALNNAQNFNMNNNSSSSVINRRNLSLQKNDSLKRVLSQDESSSFLNMNSMHKGNNGRRRSSLLSNSSDNDRSSVSFNEKLMQNLGISSSSVINPNLTTLGVDGSIELHNDDNANTTLSNHKSSISTINDYSSKKSSITSSQRSQSIATEESGDSTVNAELEPLMIPRSLYMPWSHESVSAFTEFFYTGQINPKWPFQPVVMDVFLMARLYEVPLLYDAMSQVFYALIGRKEEYIYIIKDRIDQKFKKCVQKYFKATNSKESVESYLSKSKNYQKFKDLDKLLANIDYGYCDYSLLKNLSNVLDLKEEELDEIKSSLNSKSFSTENFANRVNSTNYPVIPTKNSEFHFQSKRDFNVNSEYSGVSPKSSISKEINPSSGNNGLDLKITAMKKNSLNKLQLYNSESHKSGLASENAENSSKMVDMTDSSNVKSNKSGSYPQLFHGYYSTEPLRSSTISESLKNDLLFTELDDLLTDDYDLTTSSSSDSSEHEFMGRKNESVDSIINIKNSLFGEAKSDFGGSSTNKSDHTYTKKISNANYGFGLISAAKLNEKIENHNIEAEVGLEETMKKVNVPSVDTGNNDSANEEAGNIKNENNSSGNKGGKHALGSITLEKLSSQDTNNTIEFVIDMIYEVSTHCYDFMLSVRARNCLELCKMYKSVIKDINVEISEMDKKIDEIRHQRNEAQKAQVAQNFSNLSLGSPITQPKSSFSTTDMSNMNPQPLTSSNSIKNGEAKRGSRSSSGQIGNVNFDIISSNNVHTDNTSISSSTSSSKSKSRRFFSRKKDSNGQSQEDFQSISSGVSSSGHPKKTILDSIKPMKPKRSISLLNLFKKKT